ncbi:MAG: MopE-related protein, partial [Chitinophagales bacterium]
MKIFYFSLFALLFVAATANAQINYVTVSGSGLKDGTSWDNAYDGTQLQTAINQPGISEVWVAAGSYKPTTGSDRSVSFSLKNGVAVYGGFTGDEFMLSERDWIANSTMLSGDIGTVGINTDNSSHVVSNTGNNNTAILDGIKVMDGYSYENPDGGNAFGGGMVNQSASPEIRNCSFINNTSFSQAFFAYGGAMYNNQSSPLIINCLFQDNITKVLDPFPNCGCTLDAQGGAIYNISGNPQIINCSFNSNHATAATANAYGQGGAIFTESGTASITNCIFLNQAASAPGGSYGQAGAIYIQYEATSTISNCTFYANHADFAGAIFISGSATISNNIVWGNTDTYSYSGHGIDGFGTGNVTYTLIQGGYSGTGNINADPLFVDAVNGDLHVQSCSPAVNTGNNAAIPGGITSDLEGNSRTQQGIVDMGAYESTFTLPLTYYQDLDGDTYGNPAVTQISCSGVPLNYVSDNTDCSDDDSTVHTPQLYYVDGDLDGFGSTSTAFICSSVATSGYSTNNTDCNDGDGSVHALQSYYIDVDLDGYGSTSTSLICSSIATSGYSTDNTDCDDANGTIHALQPYFIDSDLDGYGSTATASICSSVATSGYSTNDTDCNDGDGSVHAPQSYYVDNDLDGYGSTSTALVCSSVATSGYATNNLDCNDNNPAFRLGGYLYGDADGDFYTPSSEEVLVCYDGVHLPGGYVSNFIGLDCNDNDNAIYEPVSYFVDNDLDGFGSTVTSMVCSSVATSGYSTINTDCQDGNADIYPGATEICNGMDDDCDTQIDENGITIFEDVPFGDYD